jgi:DNA-directed RNA polymerase subunit F
MEIKCINGGLLTNIEVIEILKEKAESRTKTASTTATLLEFQNREAVTTKVLKYGERMGYNNYSSAGIAKMLSQIKALNYGLTEAELMQIGNMLPRQVVELHPLIEDCDTRFDEDQLKNLLETITKALSSLS